MTGYSLTTGRGNERCESEEKQKERNMDMKTETEPNGRTELTNVKKLHKVAEELSQPGRLIIALLNSALVVVTDLAAGFIGSATFSRHFHLVLSCMVLFGPALNLWVSKYSIFANRNHYIYRMFLHSGWGWTCIFSGSFAFLLSFSIRRSISLSLLHLSRMAVVGALWWGSRRLLTLLENAAGSCYEPLPARLDGGLPQGPSELGQPLLLLHQGESKASCLKAGLLWRGCEVSEDTLLLCLCCLHLAEEMAVYTPHLALGGSLGQYPLGTPLRLLFLLCVSLLGLWLFLLLCLLAHFPHFPSQLLGGALGCLSWSGLNQGWYHLWPRWCCLG